MKRWVIAMTCGLLITGSNPAWADQVYKLRIDGLACPFCAYGAEKKLKSIKSFKSLEISINKGEAIVILGDEAAFTEDQARRLIKDAGFALRGFERVETENRQHLAPPLFERRIRGTE